MDTEMSSQVYSRLGNKIDSLNVRAPWNETWHTILKELYTTEEAALVVKMPFTLSPLERISRVTGIEETRLRVALERLCGKGLVLDLWNEDQGRYYYMPWPIAIGIFEFTMMRAGDGLDTKKMAGLFHDYFPAVYAGNFSKGERISALRVIPVEESIRESSHTEFFDYEKAGMLIESAPKLAIGLCSCRNEKLHTGSRECDAPLDCCSFLGVGAEYAVRNGFGREVSRSEMMDNLARSREHDLVFCAVNTRKNPMAICHCCKCCCNFLAGLNKFGYLNCVITSSFLAEIDAGKCNGCGKCVEVCPVNAARLQSANDPKNRKRKMGRVNPEICVGCGVCISRCRTGAMEMVTRRDRVLHPESMFEVTMLSALERGTLQNQLFDNPQSVTQEYMRSFVGAFLRLPPVKKALMSDVFRSAFLGMAKGIAHIQGKGWMVDL